MPAEVLDEFQGLGEHMTPMQIGTDGREAYVLD